MSEIKVNMENLTDEQQKQLMELIETANNPQTQKLAEGDKYYFLNTFNEIEKYAYYNTEVDNILLKNRNIFLTLEEAEFEVEKRKVIAELQNYADEHNENKIDWQNETQAKWKIFYSYNCGECCTTCNYTHKKQSSIYFTSPEICLEAINSIGKDKIKKYLFGVE